MTPHLTEILDTFQSIVDNHSILRHFKHGTAEEADDEKNNAQKYPTLHALVDSLSARPGEAVFTFALEVYDIPRDDEEDRDEVWSNTCLLLMDVINEFRHSESSASQSPYHLEDDEVELLPFTRGKANVLTGWTCVIGIKIPSNNSLCLKP